MNMKILISFIFCSGILSSQLANHLARLAVARVSDRTCIHNAQIGRFVSRRFPIPTGAEGFADQLSFVLIHLATERHKAACSFWDVHKH